MKSRTLERISKLAPFLLIGVSVAACSQTTSWKEEVLLHDGSKIIVERSTERGGRHEIGQEPPFKEQSLSFVLPATHERVTWEDNFSKELGSANFLPMQLEVDKYAVYLVVSPMGCLSYNKWGRPNPPYVIFNYRDKTWRRITLEELPKELKTPNLIFSSPDTEAVKSAQTIVSAEKIRALYDGYQIPEHRAILREPQGFTSRMCPHYSSSPKAPLPIKPEALKNN